MALRTSSGTVVGPGIIKNSRPPRSDMLIILSDTLIGAG
jgi:hypothetical protein